MPGARMAGQRAAGAKRSYGVTFPLNESVLSQSGAWTTGLAAGLDWTDVTVSGGFAFGTQTGAAGHLPTSHFNDSLAHLSGFKPDQQSIIRVRKNGVIDSTTREIECLARFAIGAHYARGYEFNYAHDGAYCEIVRWNGALDGFTLLNEGTPNGSLVDGDLLRLDAIGSTLTAYRSTDNGANWTQVSTATDSTFGSGNPGMGFWKDAGTDGNGNLGVYAFLAREL